MATLLVTGVSGFIGSNLAQNLIQKGHRILGTYNHNPPRLRESSSFKAIQADLADPDQVALIFSDPDWNIEGILHIAGLAYDWGPASRFKRANVTSTVHLLEQAKQRRMLFFIYTSSIAVHGFGIDHVNSTEDGPYSAPVSHYQRSKLEAEALIHTEADSIPWAIIRPGNVYGPGDTTVLFNMLEAIRKGIYGYVDRGRALTCPVYIDDLVQAYTKIVAIFLGDDSKAAAKINHKTYNITSGETITWKAYSEYAASFANLSQPKTAIPAWLGYFAAGLLTAVFHLVRSRTAPPLTTYRIQQASHHYHFSMARAREELGYCPKTMAPAGLEIACTDWRQKTH